MTITQNVASKLVVGFVVASMLFTLSFAPAKAATTDDLQAQITALLAQIAALQGQAGQGGQSVASGVCPYTWSMDLKTGSTGADVMKLQQFLNADVETRVAASGAGSVGAETTTFGPATAAAVSKFQTKYRAEVLTPAGLVNPTGYFGPGTRAQANKICASAPASDDDSNDDANDDANDDDSSTDLSGEASLDSDDLSDGDDTKIEEGQEDAPVAEYDVEFTDGDAQITRMDITLVASGTEEDPWDTFEDVSLWVDDEEVARADASDEDDYLDEDDGSIRFSGLDIVAMEDEELTIEIRTTVQSSVDDMPATWNVDVTALRFLDADDVSTTETVVVAATDFTIDEAGSEDEVIVKTSTTDPDSTTLAVETSEKSDWTTVFAFDLDTDDSINDIEVNELVINLYSPSGEPITDMLSDAQLLVDGEVFDDYTLANGSGAFGSTTFDIDGDLVIDAGDRVTVEFQMEFKALTGNFDEGDTIAASTTGALGDFEGVDEVVGEGAATGETHTLRTEGVTLEAGDMTETRETNGDSSTTDDQGVFTVKFDVTAFETDIFVSKTANMSSSTSATAYGVHYIMTDGSGNEVNATGTISASLSSTADTNGTRYEINEGETETFTLTVNYDPGVTGFYGVQIFGLNFNNTNEAADTQQRALPAADFETDPLNVSH